MLNVTNREWPDDFPLQSFVDYRAENGFADDMIPTTDDIEERRSGRQGNGDSESGGDIGDDMPAKQDLDIGDEPTDQAAPEPSATENPKADASEKAAEQAPEATLELTGPDKNSPEKKETPESKTEGTEKKK